MAQQNTDMLDGLQAAVIAEAKKKKENTQEYKFDPLKMYFREDYFVKGIRIVEPTIGDILDIGESKFYSGLSPFLYNSTSIRVMLWDLPQRIDWCKVSDIEVFAMLKNTGIDHPVIRLLFPDYQVENMELVSIKYPNSENSELCLYDEKNDFLLKESEYMEIAEYIRTLLNIHPKIEKAKGKTTKQWMIDEDRMNMATQKEDKNTSTLLPLISACINHPGFKYKLQELRDVGIYEFMDSVQRLQIYESTRALMGGSYSGFCDTSKVPKEQFNFMREINNV